MPGKGLPHDENACACTENELSRSNDNFLVTKIPACQLTSSQRAIV
jgi:hypothetical protein